jgi:hypothetical protein
MIAPMTQAERTRLRRLQDRWLAHPDTVAELARLERDGAIVNDVTLNGLGTPTIFHVRMFLVPEWEGFFRRRVEP